MDKVDAMLGNVSEQDKNLLANEIQRLEMRDSLRMYNQLVERCFNDCIDSFTRKSLQKQEETCVVRCAEKFMKHSLRVGMRFQELNQNAATADSSTA